jgi:hypothetical protein
MAKSETTLPRDLLEILVCPVDHAKVKFEGEHRSCLLTKRR